jgi:hypothetical protein
MKLLRYSVGGLMLWVQTALSQMGTVQGTVSLPDTSHWGGIVVSILGQNKSAVTQANGQFTLGGVVAGPVSIQAGKQFYANSRKDTTLSPGGTLSLSLSLGTFIVDTMSEHQTGKVRTSATNNGNIGAVNYFVQPGDPGFSWNGQQQLYEASLMMGVETTRVSDAARFIFGIAQDNLDQDFLSLSDLVVRTHGSDSTVLVTTYDDSRSNLPPGLPSQPLGVRTVQETYSFGDSLSNGFLIVKLILTNTTTVTLNNLLVGWFVDWDAGAATGNRGRIVTAQNTVPGINGGNPFDVELPFIRNGVYVGVAPLSQPRFRAARLASNTREVVVGAPNGGLTEANKYRYMRSRRDTVPNEDYGVQEDLSMVVSLGGLSAPSYDSSFFTLPPQSSIVVGYAFVGGNDSIQFVGNALQAQKKWVLLGQEIAGLPGVPQFSSNTTLLNIGEVGVGASHTDSVTITNTGTAALTVSSVTSTNPLFAVSPTSATIVPTGSRKFYITFSPTSIGPHNGTIVFGHDATTSPDSIDVTGIGRGEISGTYNVGVAHQLNTLKDVADLLNFGELIGPATFLLTDASYVDSLLDFTPIDGSSPQNPVTIRPASGMNTVLTLRGNSTLPVGIRFTEVSNFTIDGWNGSSPPQSRNMTIVVDTTSPTNTTGLLIRGTTKNFTFMNAAMMGYRRTSGIAMAVVVDTVGGQNADSNLVFMNLAVSRAEGGLSVRGMSVPNQHRRVVIRDCVLGGSGNQALVRFGVSLSGCAGAAVHNNIVNGVSTVGSVDTTSAYGFYLTGQNTNTHIYNNKISSIMKSGAGTGVAVGIHAGGQSGTPSRYKIWNNMVWNIGAPMSTDVTNIGGPVQGVSLVGGMYDSLYYNSVWIDGASTSNNHSSALYIVGAAAAESTRTVVWNNVFANASTMGTTGRNPVVKYFDNSGASYGTADHNDYFAAGARGAIAAVGVASTTPTFLNTLIEFQSHTGKDANSLSADPLFNAGNPLYIRTDRATPVESKAAPIPGIVTDIDGTARDGTTPDVGADEGFFVPYSLRSVTVQFDSTSRSTMLSWGDDGCCGRGTISFNSDRENFSAAGVYDPTRTTGQMVGAWRFQNGANEDLQILGFDMPSPTSMRVSGIIFTRPGTLVPGIYNISSEAFHLYFPDYDPNDSTTWNDLNILDSGVAALTVLTTSEAHGTFSGTGFNIQSNLPITVSNGSFSVNYANIVSASDMGPVSVRPRMSWISESAASSIEDGTTGLSVVESRSENGPHRSSGLTGYSIYRSVGFQPFALRDSVGASATFYTDTAVDSVGGTYRYYLRARYNNGTSEPSETVSVSIPPIVRVEEDENGLPTAFTLDQNYPNPFNPTTVIRYSVPIASLVTLKVYNILGQEIATLVRETMNPGKHEAFLDGGKLPSGVYFYRLTAGSFSQVRKMVLLK